MNPRQWHHPNLHRGAVAGPLNAKMAPTIKSRPILADVSSNIINDVSASVGDISTEQPRAFIAKNPVIRISHPPNEKSNASFSSMSPSNSTGYAARRAGREGNSRHAENTQDNVNNLDITYKDTVEIDDEDDRKAFLRLVTSSDLNLASIQYLIIHLNASQHDELADDFLAIALSQFHPRADGGNPHRLRKITIMLHGHVLFTRHNYTLVSPAVSGEVMNNLSKLMTGGLKREEKEKLAYAVNITEKSAVKAMLGIRGVDKVVIQGIGRGKMERSLQNLILASLVLPPGARSPPSVDWDWNSLLNREGVVTSTGDRVTYELRDYSDPNASSEDSPSRPDIADGYEISSVKTPAIDGEDAVMNSIKMTRASRRKLCEVTEEPLRKPLSPPLSSPLRQPLASRKRIFPSLESSGTLSARKRKRIFPGLAFSNSSSDNECAIDPASPDTSPQSEDEDVQSGPSLDGRALSEMVRIMIRQQDNDDLLASKKAAMRRELDQNLPKGVTTRRGEWFVLTGKGNNVQLGWRI